MSGQNRAKATRQTIIDAAGTRIQDVARRITVSSSPCQERLIRSQFVVADTTRTTSWPGRQSAPTNLPSGEPR